MSQHVSNENFESALTLSSAISLVLAILLGVTGALWVLPGWVPPMAASLVGPSPKAFWHLARGAGLVALILLWLSMLLGLLITNKIARLWPGAQAAFALHEYISLLGLAFAVFHALILLGDRYIHYSLTQILLPFGSVNYRPVWVGFGQIGLYAWALLAGTFYIRRQIGAKVWRLIHYASFSAFLMAVMHGLASGTDTPQGWVQTIYWFLGGSFLFLLFYRLVSAWMPPSPSAVRTAQPQKQA